MQRAPQYTQVNSKPITITEAIQVWGEQTVTLLLGKIAQSGDFTFKVVGPNTVELYQLVLEVEIS